MLRAGTYILEWVSGKESAETTKNAINTVPADGTDYSRWAQIFTELHRVTSFTLINQSG